MIESTIQMKKAMICFCSLLCSVVVISQSITELTAMAKEHNPGLRALRLAYQAELSTVDQVTDWPDPTVNLAIGILPVETRLGAQRLRVGVSQMIPWKGTLAARGDVAKAKAEVKSNLTDVKFIDIEHDIRLNYEKLRFIGNRKSIILKRILVLDALEELSKSAVRSGKGKLSNVLFIERKREELNADISLLDLELRSPTIAINRWTGRALNAEIDVEQQMQIVSQKSIITTYAQSQHPIYESFKDQILASQARIKLTHLDAKPKLGVGLDYAYIDARSDVNIPGNGRDVLMPMGSISIPLHSGRFDAIRQEETIRQEMLNAQQQEITDSYLAEIEIAYAELNHVELLVSKYQSLKTITSETLLLMRTEYATEGTRFEELLRLEMELINYDLELVIASYRQNIAQSILMKYEK